jgi:hypothetical protein
VGCVNNAASASHEIISRPSPRIWRRDRGSHATVPAAIGGAMPAADFSDVEGRNFVQGRGGLLVEQEAALG